jgi:hypothetical protein
MGSATFDLLRSSTASKVFDRKWLAKLHWKSAESGTYVAETRAGRGVAIHLGTDALRHILQPSKKHPETFQPNIFTKD